MEISNGSRPVEISNIVKQTDSGNLELDAGNLDRLLKHFNKERLKHKNKPVAFVSFTGQHTYETSLFTNLILQYIKTRERSWVKEIQRTGFQGFFYGSNLKEPGRIHIEENQQNGIYLWPELFEINHHNDAVKLVGVLFSHHPPDKTSLGALDALLNILSSSMCEIITNNTELTTRVKDGISKTNIPQLALLACSNTERLFLQKPENQTTVSSTKLTCGKTYIIHTDKLALLDKNGDIIVSNVRQQLLEKLFRSMTEQPKLQAKFFDKNCVTIETLRNFICQTVNLVNRYQSIIAQKIAYEYRIKDNFSSMNTNSSQIMQFQNTRNVQTLAKKVGRRSSSNFNDNSNTMVSEDDGQVATLLLEFLMDLKELSRDCLLNWVKSFVQKDVICTSDTLSEAYVNDLIREASLYLTQKSLLQYEAQFYTKIQNMAKTKYTNKFTEIFSALQSIRTQIEMSEKELTAEDISELVTSFKTEVLKNTVHLADTISFIFHNLLDLYKTEIQTCLGISEKVLEFNYNEMCRIIMSNPFTDSSALQKIQTNLSDELCKAYNSACMGRGKVNALREKHEQQTDSIQTKHLLGLKDFQIKVTKLINHHKGVYETEMCKAIEEVPNGFSGGSLESHHKQLKEHVLRSLSEDIEKNIRPYEPKVHLQTLDVYIEKSFVLFQNQIERNN